MVTWLGCNHPEVRSEDRSKIALQEDLRAIAGAKGDGRYYRTCQYLSHNLFTRESVQSETSIAFLPKYYIILRCIIYWHIGMMS